MKRALVFLFGFLMAGSVSTRNNVFAQPPLEKDTSTDSSYEETSGTLVQVDWGLNLLKIRTASGEVRKFQTTPGTVIFKAGQPTALHHLIEGEKATLIRVQPGTNEIRRLEVE